MIWFCLRWTNAQQSRKKKDEMHEMSIEAVYLEKIDD